MRRQTNDMRPKNLRPCTAVNWIGLLLVSYALFTPRQAVAVGNWTALATNAPGPVGLLLLLSDGTVMAQKAGGNAGSANWYRLTPDIHGSYNNGSWTTIHAMNYLRTYCSSQVL